MKELINNFIYNLKMYLKYIVKVGFKELFFDVLILVALAILSAFAYVPVGLLEDLVRTFFSSFIEFNGVGASIYVWVFNLISVCCSLLLFMYLFNNRYDFKNNKVVPVEGTHTLDRKDDIKVDSKKDDNRNKDSNKKEDLDLPKEKEEK